MAPAPEPELSKTLLRAGNFLLKMLRAEYEQRKRPIAGLDKASAIIFFKRQIKQYHEGLSPFDRPHYEHEGPREWWEAINRNQTEAAQPLAVRASVFDQ